MVRAKFKLSRIEITMQGREKWDAKGKPIMNEQGHKTYEEVEMKTLVFFPVMPRTVNPNGSDENVKFWRASPSGEIKLGIVNPEAASYFEMGKDYYFDISEAKA